MSDFYDDQVFKMFWKGTETKPLMSNELERASVEAENLEELWGAPVEYKPEDRDSYDQQTKQLFEDMYPWTKDTEDSDAVNPSHYKDIVPGYEYFDIMDHMLEGWEGPEAHALGNGLKYLFRLGKKDEAAQELGKAIWYLTRLKDYLEAGGYKEYRKM